MSFYGNLLTNYVIAKQGCSDERTITYTLTSTNVEIPITTPLIFDPLANGDMTTTVTPTYVLMGN
jgi:hypothetical protein